MAWSAKELGARLSAERRADSAAARGEAASAARAAGDSEARILHSLDRARGDLTAAMQARTEKLAAGISDLTKASGQNIEAIMGSTAATRSALDTLGERLAKARSELLAGSRSMREDSRLCWWLRLLWRVL